MALEWNRMERNNPHASLAQKEKLMPFDALADKFATQAEKALSNKSLVEIVEERLQQIRSSNEGGQEAICREIVKENPDAFPDSIEGEEKECAAYTLALAHAIIKRRASKH